MNLRNSIKIMVHFIWPVMSEGLCFFFFSFPLTKGNINFVHIKMYATPYPAFWIIIYKTSLTKSYRQIVGIPMGKHLAPLVADLFYTDTCTWILFIRLGFEFDSMTF